MPTQAKQGAYGEIPRDLPMLLTPTVAGRILNCSDKHVRDLCNKGEIKAVKTGGLWRINRDALLEQYQLIAG